MQQSIVTFNEYSTLFFKIPKQSDLFLYSRESVLLSSQHLKESTWDQQQQQGYYKNVFQSEVK